MAFFPLSVVDECHKLVSVPTLKLEDVAGGQMCGGVRGGECVGRMGAEVLFGLTALHHPVLLALASEFR